MTQRRRLTQPEVDHDTRRCVVDETGTIVYVSPAIGWSLGVPAAALVNRPVKSIITVVSSLEAGRGKLDLEGISSGFYEVALLRENRDPLLMPARIDLVEAPGNRAYTVIWLDPDGKLKRHNGDDLTGAAQEFATFISDSTARIALPAGGKQDCANIDNTDSELRHFLNLTGDLMGVYARDMSFVRVNPAFNRVLGFSDAELKHFPFIDLIHPDEREQVFMLMQKVLRPQGGHETRIDFECRARCKDGSFRHIEWAHKAAGDMIYIVGRDVTNIKQHEAELERREGQLLEAQKIGRMGHWTWEIDRSAMEWSDQIYAIFGVDKKAFSPTMDNINSMLLKRDLGRIYRAFQRALVRKKDYKIEFRLRRPAYNGEQSGLRYIRCEGRCKIDPKTGMVESLYGIMQDITERTLHERALREAKEAAESAYASKTRFLANMSHELRTPLNAIIGFSEMIQRQLLGPVGNAKYLDYIGGIHQSGEHLLDLINDILDMSKIEIGKYELYVEKLNVGKVMRLAIHMVEGRAHDEQVRLIADDIPDDLHIEADRRALMQVVLNLLSNAVKFTRAGGQVEVRCVEEPHGIAIVVADTGVGIPKDKLQMVTLPFEQVSSEFTRNHEGSGLGLAITKELIEMHGGRLDIASEVDVGTTVSVSLPEKVQASATVHHVAAEVEADLEEPIRAPFNPGFI